VRSILRFSGALGIAPPGVCNSLRWLVTDSSPSVRPLSAPREEVEELLDTIRLMLCRGAMHLWMSQRARLQSWWTRSASEARTQTLLLSAAHHTLARRSRELDKRRQSRIAEQEKRANDKGTDARSCRSPRAVSNRLRRDPPRRVADTGCVESPLELAEWMAGDSKKTEMRKHIPLF
jgi:hypothetical protein